MRSPKAFLFLSIFCLAGCDETPHAHYARAADAVSAGAVTRGWIPEVMKSDVSDIHESHDLDSNHGSASFHYTPGLIPKLQQHCVSRSASNGRLIFQCGAFTLSLDPNQQRGLMSH